MGDHWDDVALPFWVEVKVDLVHEDHARDRVKGQLIFLGDVAQVSDQVANPTDKCLVTIR